MQVVKWLKVASICACVLAVPGCGNGRFVTVPDPLQGLQVASQSNTSGTSTPSQPPKHLSNGIGMGDTVQWIEAHWGKPSRFVTPMDSSGTGDVYYRKNAFYVRYSNHRAYAVDDKLASPISRAAAAALIKSFIPADSQRQTMIVSRVQHTEIDRYSSTSIQALWPPQISSSLVGTLTVQLSFTSNGKVEEIFVTAGETLYPGN